MRFRQRFDSDYDPAVYGTDATVGMGADQSFAAECDINVLMRRVALGAELVPRADYLSAMYEDLTNVPGDYLEAVNLVAQAEDHFDSMPASVRSKFQNDPYQLLHFLADERNRAEAIELGLLPKPPVADAGSVVNKADGSVATAVGVGGDASGGSAAKAAS